MCKKEQMYIINWLLKIQGRLHQCEVILAVDNPMRSNDTTDDERYLKMAMRIDPTDKNILYRKKILNCLRGDCERLNQDVQAYHMVQ